MHLCLTTCIDTISISCRIQTIFSMTTQPWPDLEENQHDAGIIGLCWRLTSWIYSSRLGGFSDWHWPQSSSDCKGYITIGYHRTKGVISQLMRHGSYIHLQPQLDAQGLNSCPCQVLTPDVPEDNGFQGGVLSSPDGPEMQFLVFFGLQNWFPAPVFLR